MKGISNKSAKIGWIGTGVMGNSMVNNLLDAGYVCSIYSRTKNKAENLIAKGAIWESSPAEVVKNSDVIFSIVGFPEDVKEIYFSENGIEKVIDSGKIVIDMTTTKPSLAKEIYQKLENKGVGFIDAPVSGGDVGAKNGTLSIMAGGDKEIFDKLLPVFEILGKNIVYQGKAGSGQHAKMCNQIVISGTMIGVCESLLYAYKAGLDIDVLLSSISKGAAGCWTLDNLAPRIAGNNFEPGFFIDHFIKDLGIAIEESEKMNLNLKGLGLVKKLYLEAQKQGLGEKGTQALFLSLKEMSEE